MTGLLLVASALKGDQEIKSILEIRTSKDQSSLHYQGKEALGRMCDLISKDFVNKYRYIAELLVEPFSEAGRTNYDYSIFLHAQLRNDKYEYYKANKLNRLGLFESTRNRIVESNYALENFVDLMGLGRELAGNYFGIDFDTVHDALFAQYFTDKQVNIMPLHIAWRKIYNSSSIELNIPNNELIDALVQGYLFLQNNPYVARSYCELLQTELNRWECLEFQTVSQGSLALVLAGLCVYVSYIV